ncbi:unnamed protein product [Schistocephalus solidus]|uniref:Uncharacterized protein n=1 Tax=Schistocephalus solidus TaxID=70667 RepID=A0A183TJM3_SCHSO|nr:unnamed protein product [Schistocephalus solidus]
MPDIVRILVTNTTSTTTTNTLTDACFSQRHRERLFEGKTVSFSSITAKVVCFEGAIPDMTWLAKVPNRTTCSAFLEQIKREYACCKRISTSRS